jgi:hypothetical protein
MCCVVPCLSCRLVYLEEALAKEFSCAMRVSDRSRIAKQSIQAAGLRGITGLYLYEIVRADGTRLPAVSHDTVLEVRLGVCINL